MKTIELKLFKFNELNEEAKEAVVEFYENYILPDIIYDYCQYICDEAVQNGVVINSIDLYEIYGEFNASPEFVLEQVIETGLFGKEDSKYNYYKRWYEHILEMDKKIEELEDRDEIDEACKVAKEREESFEEWKEEFLRVILDKYHEMLRATYDGCLEKEYIEEFFESNDYFFTEDGKVFRGTDELYCSGEFSV